MKNPRNLTRQITYGVLAILLIVTTLLPCTAVSADAPITIDLMEYSSDSLAQAAYVTNDTGATTWLQVAPGLGAGTNSILSLVVFNNELYGGTYNGSLFKWNGVNAWVSVAPPLGTETRIYSLAVFNNTIYGGTYPNGMLYQWNGVNAWVQVAPKLGSETQIRSLAVFNNTLYGGSYSNASLLKWNGVNAWVQVAPKPGTETYIFALAVFNNTLYGGAAAVNGSLYAWNGVDAWVQKTSKLGSETGIYSLAVLNNTIFGGTNPNGNLYQWNGVNAWVSKAPMLGNQSAIFSLAVLNNTIYGGTSPNGSLYQWSYNLLAASESTIKTQGGYSLKAVAAITSSLNKTLTRTISTPIDLTNQTTIKFDINARRTGSNIKIGLHDTGGVTTEITPNITSANTWQTVAWDISGVINANKDAIDKIIITIVNASAANTFYIDNMVVASYNLTTNASSGGTVSTPGIGTYTYNASQIVNISATANSCYHFVNWTGSTTNISNVNASSTTINMNRSNQTATANFAINTYNVTYTAGPGGTITGVSSSRYTTDIYTSASDGYAYATNASYANAWGTATGTLDPNNSSYFHIGQAFIGGLYQVFRAFVYFNTATIPSGASISSANVSLRGGNDQTATDFSITIQNGMPTYPHDPYVAGDYAKSDYSGNGGSFNTSAFVYGYMNISMNPTGISWINTAGWTNLCLESSRDIAGITPTGFEYIEVVAYDYGSLRPYLEVVYNLTNPQTVNCGASGPTVTAVPNACYHFVNWSDGSTANPRTDTNVTANITVTANFAINTSTLTYNAGTGGTINGTTPQNVTCGANGTAVTAVPNAYYTFVNWSDGVTTASRTDTNVTANITVTANFAIYSYMLSISTDGNGITTPAAGTYGPYTNGTVVSIAATPNSCYTFNNWSGNTSTIANVISNSTNITMSGNYLIKANFAMNSYILWVSANNSNNTPYFSGSNPFACGTNVSIYANTSAGYVFAGWTPIDGIDNASATSTTVLMTQNRNLIAAYTAAPSTPTPTPTPTATSTPTGGMTNTTYLSWHITSGNFSLTKSADGYIMANISAGVNSNRGKYLVKQLTVYIQQRATLSGIGRGGIWGDDAIVGLGSLTMSSTWQLGGLNLFNGDVYVQGPVSVTSSNGSSGDMISGTLYCNSFSAPTDFRCANNGSANCSPQPCPVQTLPYIGDPQNDYFRTNLSTGTQNWSQADIYHEYVFNSSVTFSLTSGVNQVWQNNNASTRQLKPGYYYSNGTITLSGHSIRGMVTFIAKQIIIINDDSTGDGNAYIGLQPYDDNNLLLWAMGNSGKDIWIQGADAAYHPCVELEGILFAPSGEVRLDGTGSNPSLWWLTLPSVKAMIDKGGIRAQNLTITGHDWWFYRW